MKAITIWQPWAALYFIPPGDGFQPKDIENRDWWTDYRGDLAIHAGKRLDYDEFAAAERLMARKAIRSPLVGTVPAKDYVYQAIIGVVRQVGCVKWSPSPWFVGEYGFVERAPRLLSRPIPCRGMPGLWDLPPDVEAEVERQLRDARR